MLKAFEYPGMANMPSAFGATMYNKEVAAGSAGAGAAQKRREEREEL